MDRVPPFSPARRWHFLNFYRESLHENVTTQIGFFVVVTSFLWFSCKDSHESPLKHNVFSKVLIQLWLSLEENHTFWKHSFHWCAFVLTVFIKLSLSLKENHTFWKLSLHWCAFVLTVLRQLSLIRLTLYFSQVHDILWLWSPRIWILSTLYLNKVYLESCYILSE